MHELKNGIRLIHQHTDSPVAYSALMINAGSRDELNHEIGAAHLAEHLIFKETHKRKAYHILNRLENVGGDLNAYTTKEDTCIHAAFLNEHYARALELFSDIVFGHKITKDAFDIEKKVVSDEIKSYMDNPSEMIFDHFDELLFSGHPLGNSTLGTIQQIKKINIPSVEQFISRNYIPGQIVISSVGNIPFKRLVYFVEKYMSHYPPGTKEVSRQVPAVAPSFSVSCNKKNHQVHCIMGRTCESSDRKFRIAMTMLTNLLGGPGMNTRLNMSMRERNGWVYHVEASYTPYSDVGVFNIYFGTDKIYLDQCLSQVKRELAKLKNTLLKDSQLKKLQQQIIGQLAIGSDNSDARMLSNGKSLLMYHHVDNLQDICKQIIDIDARYLNDVANRVFDHLNILVYQ
ncbi:MAG: insulinase family protein [Bacteroidales bacterium]|nr:insulinase family protein [Bacteroidales bacterium]